MYQTLSHILMASVLITTRHCVDYSKRTRGLGVSSQLKLFIFPENT